MASGMVAAVRILQLELIRQCGLGQLPAKLRGPTHSPNLTSIVDHFRSREDSLWGWISFRGARQVGQEWSKAVT